MIHKGGVLLIIYLEYYFSYVIVISYIPDIISPDSIIYHLVFRTNSQYDQYYSYWYLITNQCSCALTLRTHLDHPLFSSLF